MPHQAASTDAAIDRVPFFQDFSCRRREFELLQASFKSTLCPTELDERDRAAIVSVAGEEEPAERAGLWPMALIGGASGMGKSRLSSEVKRLAAGSGVRVQEVFCFERQGVPLLPILRIVKELISGSPSREALWESHSAVLGRVFPELAEELGTPALPIELPGDDGRVQLFDALYRILSEFSREVPILILIHDLHRADQGTVEFLEYLGRNVYLDERPRRRDPDLEPSDEPDDAWKHIRRRDTRRRSFVTDSLDGEGQGAPIDGHAARIMIIANYLETGQPADGADVDQDVEARLAALEEEPYVFRVSLPNLDREETESLIRETLGGRVFEDAAVDRIHESTAGNPFQVVEICRCLFEEGHLPSEMPRIDHEVVDLSGASKVLDELLAPSDEPESEPGVALSARLVARRFATLDAVDLKLIQLLAALRRPVRQSVLVDLTALGEPEVRASISRLQARDFVRSQGGGESERYYLVHEDYVRVAYQDADDVALASLHLDLGRVLASHERAGEPVRTFEIYEHLRRSSEPREAVPFGVRAATYFSGAYAVDLAARIATSLLDLVGESSDAESPDAASPDDVHWDILELAGRLELRRGEVPAAKGHIKRLLEEKALPDDQRFRAAMLLAEIYRAGSESHKGIKTLNRALKQLADLDESQRARIAAELARLRLERQDPKRASNVALTALKELEASEDVDTSAERIALLEILAASHLARREIVSAIQIYQQLLELVEEVGDPAQLAGVLNALGRVYYDRGNYFRAARYLFRALDAIRRIQDLRALSRAYDMLGKVYRNSGDTLRGIEYFHRSLRLRERIGDTEGLSPTLNSLGSLYAHRGDYLEAIRYFQRSVEISERVGDTAGIVRAFLHLGRAYLDVGELRQVESLAKQILILSQEFNLVALEGEGHRLHGDLMLVRGDLKGAERELRKAVEIATKRGRKSGEASATLSLGALLSEKEEWEAALKQISKGQLLAEEIQSVPHQVRAQLLKGNVYRFLKGGNIERAKECFRRGLELVSGESQLPLQWELDYSVSKVFQSNLEFVEAAESYRRAQRILDRIVERLPEGIRVTYTEDRRRKTFYDDYRRFEKEASGRMTMPQAELNDVPRSERVWRLPDRAAIEPEATPAVGVDVGRILETVERLSDATDLQSWAESVLSEARRLVPAPSGFLVGIGESDDVRVLAASDMSADGEWVRSDKLPGALAREVARQGASVRSADEDWDVRLKQLPEGSSYKSRSLVAIPFLEGDAVRAVLYLERPSAQNPFDSDAQRTLERFARSIAGQLSLLARLDAQCRYHHSRILTPAGFDEFLPTVVRAREAGQSFGFVEVMAPGLDVMLRESEDPKAFAQQIADSGPAAADCVVHVGDDTFAFGYLDKSAGELEALRSALGEEFARLVERVSEDAEAAVTSRCILPEERHASEEDLSRFLWARVFRRRVEFDVGSEIGSLTAGDLTLKEAKTALEKRYITAELQKSRGNITRAAESLGVHRPQLSNLIKKYNVRREDFE